MRAVTRSRPPPHHLSPPNAPVQDDLLLLPEHALPHAGQRVLPLALPLALLLPVLGDGLHVHLQVAHLGHAVLHLLLGRQVLVALALGLGLPARATALLARRAAALASARAGTLGVHLPALGGHAGCEPGERWRLGSTDAKNPRAGFRAVYGAARTRAAAACLRLAVWKKESTALLRPPRDAEEMGAGGEKIWGTKFLIQSGPSEREGRGEQREPRTTGHLLFSRLPPHLGGPGVAAPTGLPSKNPPFPPPRLPWLPRDPGNLPLALSPRRASLSSSSLRARPGTSCAHTKKATRKVFTARGRPRRRGCRAWRRSS